VHPCAIAKTAPALMAVASRDKERAVLSEYLNQSIQILRIT
jgi:hypothetical protein